MLNPSRTRDILARPGAQPEPDSEPASASATDLDSSEPQAQTESESQRHRRTNDRHGKGHVAHHPDSLWQFKSLIIIVTVSSAAPQGSTPVTDSGRNDMSVI